MQVSCGTSPGNYARFLRLCNHVPLNIRVQVQFGVQGGPEPEPDHFGPELRVQFRVWGSLLNRTDGPVQGSGNMCSKPN
jgi:hypothetical protein